MRRREFLRTAAAGAAVHLGGRGAMAADLDLRVLTERAGATISPQIYGHFIEHLGGVIYDGVWVGEGSKIPNIGGIRKQFVDEMKRIGAPNMRWPGGCFADGYHWRDGIGARAKRQRMYNYWEQDMRNGLHATETNQFGIHEFMRLCKLVGAEPYVAGNVGSSTPKEFHDWVAYCNAPAGTLSLADERAANGDREPFGVKYWGVGNESWGCGGNMKPEEYARLYRQFIAQFPVYTRPFYVACGPRGHSADYDIGWTTGFFEALQGTRAPLPDGFGLHYYSDFRTSGTKAGVFDEAGWYTAMRMGQRTEDVIQKHWDAMGVVDTRRRTRFVIDEWGLWYPPGEEIGPGYILSQPITLRDALHSALTFDVFNRHSDKVAMANVAQTINCIHSLFLAREEKFVRTPVYHVFDMYRPHMGARSVPVEMKAAELDVAVLQGRAKMAQISASASVREKRVFVTVSNVSLGDGVGVRLDLGAMRAKEARGMVLTHADRQGTNSWGSVEAVRPAAMPTQVSAGVVSLVLPKMSVAAIEVEVV